MFNLFSMFRKSSQRSQKFTGRKLHLERLEGRQLMASVPIESLGDNLSVFLPPDVPRAEGSITFNSTSGVLTVEASNNYDDSVKVFMKRFEGHGDLVTVELNNVNLPQVAGYYPSQVKRVVVRGYAGNDLIDNRTAVPMTAYGGAGHDKILGGLGDDTLLGGDGDDFLDGRRSADIIFGELGTDALFGDDGDDALYGGDGVDYLFGGNGVDNLYGESGNDKLYGGGGIDNLLDSSGTNIKYTDFGPTYNVSASGFVAFDWFDRYLVDPAVRSEARLLHRDGVLSREDMLQIYSTIATEGIVSATPNVGIVTTGEFADLKALTSSRVNLQNDTRYFAGRVALGDPANAYYQQKVLGNLKGGDSADKLNKLVDKWFMGGDLPAIGAVSSGTPVYRWAQGSLFVGGPSYTDIDQNALSDCYFLAALGQVARRSPSTIVNMFADNQDGTFTVRFYKNGSPVYVTVDRSLPAYTSSEAVYAGWGIDANGFQRLYYDRGNELWVALAEKAYAQLNASGWIGQDGTNSYRGIEVGEPGAAFLHLTGITASNHALSSSEIAKALAAGKAITMTTKTTGVASNITPGHIYMLVGYNSTTKTYELINPHNVSQTSFPAVMRLTWSQITTSFSAWTSVLL